MSVNKPGWLGHTLASASKSVAELPAWMRAEQPTGDGMIGLDDVRERVREGVAAHGWPAVLYAIADELYRHWEHATEGPSAPAAADRLLSQVVLVRAAAKEGQS